MKPPRENPGINWADEFIHHMRRQNIQNASPNLTAYMKQKDQYLPPALGEFSEDDLNILLALLDRLDKETEQIPYYMLYRLLVEKLLVLLIEQYPEQFAVLSMDLKDRLFSTKIKVPDEQALYNRLYIYWIGNAELPFEMMSTGLSMREFLKRIADEEPGSIDDRLIDLICGIDSQYYTYFMDRLRLER